MDCADCGHYEHAHDYSIDRCAEKIGRKRCPCKHFIRNKETRCEICEALIGNSTHTPEQCIGVWKLRYQSSSDALTELIQEHTEQSEELDVLKLAEGLQNPVYEQLVADRNDLQSEVERLKTELAELTDFYICEICAHLHFAKCHTGKTDWGPK